MDQHPQTEVEALKALFEARFAAYDRAITLLQAQADKSPTIAEVALSVVHLRELMHSMFSAVAQKFEGNAIALIAAFAASKEAVSEQQKSNTTAISKSEAATGEQLRQLQAMWGTSTSALSDKIDDIKMRLSAIEAQGVGRKDEQTSHQQSNAFMITLVVAAIAAGGLFVNIISSWSPISIERALSPPQREVSPR